MKFTLSVAVLALAASQAMAVVPTPIKGCTKTVIVQPTDLSCVDFATANGCTFDDLLKWNTRLSKACDNLDVGAPICVSMTQGAASTGAPTNVPTTAGPAPTNPAGSVPPTSAVGTQTSAPAGGATAPAGATSSTASSATTAPPSPKATSSASGSKASMALAAAGVLLSVAYML
ncbi:hypothetical protein EMPS_00557 [Entomortierella parvispora]|uniref:LysM domain-containing protein n=1 Tax=Entomortierella parvispora TaxID=205924 RepID=A0A9P3H152_9FUNG|nr:hypothetical protein EMPS_00557 [Entomortierella parvispora]